jgi:hypothetical protein
LESAFSRGTLKDKVPVLVSFMPEISGDFEDTLVLRIGKTGVTAEFSLSATATKPCVEIANPEIGAFGTVLAKTGDTARSVRIANCGGESAGAITAAIVQESRSGSFRISPNSIANESDTFTVAFTPQAVGTATAVLLVRGAAVKTSLNLEGTAVECVEADPTTIAFPTRRVGGRASVAHLSIHNCSAIAIPKSAFQLNAKRSPFTLNFQSRGDAIAVDAIEKATVSFKPRGPGSSTATLTLQTTSTKTDSVIGVIGDARRSALEKLVFWSKWLIFRHRLSSGE